MKKVKLQKKVAKKGKHPLTIFQVGGPNNPPTAAMLEEVRTLINTAVADGASTVVVPDYVKVVQVML